MNISQYKEKDIIQKDIIQKDKHDSDFYLLCRHRFQEMNHYIDNIIQSYELIDEISCSMNCFKSQEFSLENDKNIFIEKKKNIMRLIEMCDKNISLICKHEFECDMIDISPDRSERIVYCVICGFTK